MPAELGPAFDDLACGDLTSKQVRGAWGVWGWLVRVCVAYAHVGQIHQLTTLLRAAKFPSPSDKCLSPAGEYNLRLGIMKVACGVCGVGQWTRITTSDCATILRSWNPRWLPQRGASHSGMRATHSLSRLASPWAGSSARKASPCTALPIASRCYSKPAAMS